MTEDNRREEQREQRERDTLVQLTTLVTDVAYIKQEMESMRKEINKEIERLRTQVNDLTQSLDSRYVTRAEFDPVQKLVFGLVALILTAVVGAVVALVVM